MATHRGKKKHIPLPRQKMQTKQNENTLEKQIPIVRTVPDDVSLEFSDGLMIQHKDGMFILSFLQTQYPLVTSADDLRDVEMLEQRSVARVIVAPHQMAKNVSVMQKNFERFLASQPEVIQESLRESYKQVAESGEIKFDAGSEK